MIYYNASGIDSNQTLLEKLEQIEKHLEKYPMLNLFIVNTTITGNEVQKSNILNDGNFEFHAGDILIDQDTNLYEIISVGTTSVFVDSNVYVELKGATGATGATGPAGPAGPAGADGSGTNENLLINSNFSINQRGQSSYTGSNIYTVDRVIKYINNGAIEPISNGGLTINNVSGSGNCDYAQIIENGYNLFNGKYVTLSANVDGVIYTVTHKVVTGTLNRTFIQSGGTNIGELYIQTTSNNILKVWGRVYAGKSYNIYWWKLELGNKPTIYTPPLVAEELPKCQRYFRIDRNLTKAYNTYSLNQQFTSFGIEMRTIPTTTIYGVDGSGNKQSSPQTVYDITANTNINIGTNAQYISKYGYIVGSSGVFTAGNQYYYEVESDAELY